MCKVERADGRGVKAAPKAAHAEEEKTSITENMLNTDKARQQTSFLLFFLGW